MPMPKQISLDLDEEAPPPVAAVAIPPERKPQLIDLMMAQAIVAVWRNAQEVDHDEH